VRSVLLWAGVLVPPAAWTAQLVVGYTAEEADCSLGSRSFDASHAVTLWISVAAGIAAVLALGGAAWLVRETRRYEADARGRVSFMAACGILVGFLFLALIVLTAVGTTHFHPCRAG
jgi:hypothetical protein